MNYIRFARYVAYPVQSISRAKSLEPPLPRAPAREWGVRSAGAVRPHKVITAMHLPPSRERANRWRDELALQFHLWPPPRAGRSARSTHANSVCVCGGGGGCGGDDDRLLMCVQADVPSASASGCGVLNVLISV